MMKEYLHLAEMIRRDYRVEMIAKITGIDKFFVNKIQMDSRTKKKD